VPPSIGVCCVRRDEICGWPAALTGETAGAAVEDDPAGGPSDTVLVLADMPSAAAGDEVTFVEAGGGSLGSAGIAGAGAPTAASEAREAGAGGAGAVDGVAFRFRTERSAPGEGASSEASSVAASWCAADARIDRGVLREGVSARTPSAADQNRVASWAWTKAATTQPIRTMGTLPGIRRDMAFFLRNVGDSAKRRTHDDRTPDPA